MSLYLDMAPSKPTSLYLKWYLLFPLLQINVLNQSEVQTNGAFMQYWGWSFLEFCLIMMWNVFCSCWKFHNLHELHVIEKPDVLGNSATHYCYLYWKTFPELFTLVRPLWVLYHILINCLEIVSTFYYFKFRAFDYSYQRANKQEY